MLSTTHKAGSSTDDTRLRILAAAKEVYEQNGTRGTTTRLVAERAGVNEATLFRHFGNKHALLNAMRELACPMSMVEPLLAANAGDPRTDLRRIAGTLVSMMHRQRAMMCISLAEDARGEVLSEERSAEPEWRGPMELRSGLAKYFARLIAEGVIQGNPQRLAAYFMGMCFSYVVARKIWDSKEIRPDDLDFMVDVFFNGVQ